MGSKDHRFTFIYITFQILPDGLLTLQIQRCSRLIHNKDRRISRQSTGNTEAFFHSSGQLAALIPSIAGIPKRAAEPVLRSSFICFLFPLCHREEIISYRKLFHKRIFLRNIRHIPGKYRWMAKSLFPVNLYTSLSAFLVPARIDKGSFFRSHLLPRPLRSFPFRQKLCLLNNPAFSI